MSSIEARIIEARGVRVMVDRNLAELYGISTKALNQAVTRNPWRFPEDFAFRLTPEEVAGRSGARRAPSRVFTEPAARCARSPIRRKLQGRIRRDPRADAAAGARERANRLPASARLTGQ